MMMGKGGTGQGGREDTGRRWRVKQVLESFLRCCSGLGEDRSCIHSRGSGRLGQRSRFASDERTSKRGRKKGDELSELIRSDPPVSPFPPNSYTSHNLSFSPCFDLTH